MTILSRLLPSQDIDALLGDIAEEAPRRSRIWYWSQLLVAVIVGSWRAARGHAWLALRAIATGAATLAAYFTIVLRINGMFQAWSNDGLSVSGHRLMLPNPALLQPPYDVILVLAVNLLGFTLSGSAIVRLHRAHGIALAMPFMAMMTSLALIPLAIVLADTGPGMRSMSALELIVTFGPLFLSIPGGILLGGYAAIHRAEGD